MNFSIVNLSQKVQEQLQDHQDPTLVNLASNEYFKALKVRKRKLPVVTCVFHDYKDAARTPKVISFLAKRARGMMARFIIEQRVDPSAGLKDFKAERYRFRPEISSESTFVFGRAFIPTVYLLLPQPLRIRDIMLTLDESHKGPSSGLYHPRWRAAH